MPLIYYIQTSVVGLVITLIIAFHMIRHDARRTSSRKIFGALILANIILLSLEMLLNIFTGIETPAARALLPVIVLIFYILNPVPEALWVIYLNAIIRKDKRRENWLLIILVSIPLLINAFFSLISLHSGLLFRIDAQNTYHRGPWFSILILSCYSYLFYNMILIIIKRRSIPKHEFWVSFSAALLPVVAGALQGLFYGISLIWTALSFSLLIVYMNLQSEQVYQELMALDKMKDEFLANTSHELRTPLNGIINITGSILEREEELNDTQRQNLRVVVSAARRLYSLINDILDVSSMKNGEIELRKKPVNLYSVAETTLYVVSRLKGDKEIVFVNGIPEKMPPVNADPDRLYQVFYNLLGNALKFTVHGKIETGAAVRQGQAEIWVEDTGGGISPERIQDIFKPFYQINSDDTREVGGTGLGLSITRNLIELHGGTIRAASEEGKGSRFTFTIPLCPQTHGEIYEERGVKASMEEAFPVLTPRTTAGAKQKKNYSILAADDDPASLTAVFNILDHEGYFVKAVASGEEVLKELEQRSEYNLVILDVMMPRMSGYEALQKIRLRFPPMDLPVLLLTARARPEDLQAGFEAGASDYLAKPFEALELKARVKTLVQLKESIRTRMETELSFLQAQIKPHFLYNSLSVIAALSTKEPQRTEELLYDLSDYLRGSFRFENYNGVTPLSSELVTIRAYLSIEQERFRDRLKVEFDIDETIEIFIPMLVLQPLVENAIRHGVSKKPGGGTVKLIVKRSKTGTVITVSDDGAGISADKLPGILEGKEDTSGIGLNNIQRRMLLCYGHGLEICSSEGQGTTVVVRIPDEGR